jgi:hypothetical protein
MMTHPIAEPFGPAFIEKKGAVGQRFDSGNDVLGNIADFGDFLPGEHMPKFFFGDLVKIFLTVRHIQSPSFRGVGEMA